MAERRTKQMSVDELVKIVRAHIDHNDGTDSALVADRKQALDYFHGRPRGDEMTGCSTVQSLDVADMIEAVMSEIMPSIENDDLAVFIPRGEADTEQARIESQAVNYAIMGLNDGYMLFEQSVKDALLLKNGWAKCYVHEEQQQTTQSFIGIDPVAAVELLQIDDPNTEVEITSTEDSEAGQGLVDVTARITRTERKLVIEAKDPTRMVYNTDHDSTEVKTIDFIAERDYPTRTDLINQGIDIETVYELPAVTQDTETDSNARNVTGQGGRQHLEAEEAAMEKVERHCCYLLIDYEGTGIAELRYIEIVDNTILVNEPSDGVPFATGTPLPEPHRINGLSLFNKLKEVQDIKTGTLRNWMDNSRNCNWGRYVLRDGSVNYDDYTNPRPGGGIRAQDPATDVVPMQIVDTGPSNLALLEYADQMRSERGGAALDMQSAEAQVAGTGSMGVDRVYTAKEKLAGRLARNIAKTLVKQLFLLVHDTMRLQMRGEMEIFSGGQFQTVNPSQWREREAVIVKTGMTLAERNQTMNALRAIYSEQKELIVQGQEGVLTTKKQAHNALIDMATAGGIDNPERYYTDPESPEAQQAAQAQQQAQQQQQKQMERQQEQLLQTQVAIEQMKQQGDMNEQRLKAVIDLVALAVENGQFETQQVAAALTAVNTAQGADDGRQPESEANTG